jgi:hypothetical protein
MVESAPFAIRSTDGHSVSSALSAAERSWRRGESSAVIRWLERAAEAATEAADDARARELRECAEELSRTAKGPSSVHLLTKLAQPKPEVPPPASTNPMGLSGLGGEVTRGRLPDGFEEDTNEVAIFQLRDEAAKKKAETGPTAHAPLAKVPVRSSEAVRVLLWRDATGALYVTTAGAPAPAHAIEAMLTAIEPDTDLVALLEGPA